MLELPYLLALFFSCYNLSRYEISIADFTLADISRSQTNAQIFFPDQLETDCEN